MKPRLGYIILGSARTGSGVLSDTLWRTELAGQPDQYFLESNIDRFSRRWGTSTFPQYLDAMLERTTSSNGVFGLRLPKANTEELALRLQSCGILEPLADWGDAAGLFENILGHVANFAGVCFVLQVLCKAGYTGYRITDLVGNARGESADGCESLVVQ